MTKEELYQAELKQADQDHHTPTAGAMTGHILANLWLHQQKVNQARLYTKGCASLFINQKEKYAPGKDQLFDLIKDFDTQLLFFQKAIALGKQEGKMKLVHTIVDLDDWMRAEILAGQNFLGNDLMEGRYQEEDDEDDD